MNLTRFVTNFTFSRMMAPRSRVMKSLAAVVLIGSFALWHPAMMACVAAMPGMGGMRRMGHAAPQRGVPQHVPGHDCCAGCVCTITPSLPTAATPSLSVALEVARPGSDRARFIPVLVVPHSLPFSIGLHSSPRSVTCRALVPRRNRLRGLTLKWGCCTQYPNCVPARACQRAPSER